MTLDTGHGSAHGKSGVFSTTHWSVVLAAGSGDHAAAADALEQLCAKYWYPIYAFVRRRGSDAHAAEDLTQAFFAHLLEKESLKRVDRQKGKFRTFLLGALANFLNNERDKAQTLKRGGKCQIVSLDETAAEDRYRREPVESAAPEKLFDRRWATSLLEHVLDRLKREYSAEGKAELFAKLEPCLTGDASRGFHDECAAALGMNPGAVRTALHRLRQRFGQLLRDEVSQTVASEAEVDGEIRHLFAAVSLAEEPR
jgi:RNA polymerase sigma-70 factor (ECF subfamily)